MDWYHTLFHRHGDQSFVSTDVRDEARDQLTSSAAGPKVFDHGEGPTYQKTNGLKDFGDSRDPMDPLRWFNDLEEVSGDE